MKRRTWIVAGVILLVLGLAAGWLRYATRPQEITVTFAGFTNSYEGFSAVFRLTNGTPNTVYCGLILRRESGALLWRDRPFYILTLLRSHTGWNWIYPVPDTNSVFHLQAECWEPTSSLARRANEWITGFNSKSSSFQVPLWPERRYHLACPTEVGRVARKVEEP
jgi:hypothetical protein